MTTTTKTRPNTVSPDFDFGVFGDVVWIEPNRSRAPNPFTIGVNPPKGRKDLIQLSSLFQGRKFMEEGYHPKDPILLRMYGDTIIIGRWERPLEKETVTYKKRAFLFFKRTHSYQRDVMGHPRRASNGNLFINGYFYNRFLVGKFQMYHVPPSVTEHSFNGKTTVQRTDGFYVVGFDYGEKFIEVWELDSEQHAISLVTVLNGEMKKERKDRDPKKAKAMRQMKKLFEQQSDDSDMKY